MKVEFLKDTKDEAKIAFENEDSTFANALKDELWQTKGTDVAVLSKKHPLTGKPELTLQGKEPKKLIKSASQSFKKKVEDFEKAVLKEI